MGRCVVKERDSERSTKAVVSVDSDQGTVVEWHHESQHMMAQAFGRAVCGGSNPERALTQNTLGRLDTAETRYAALVAP